MRIPRPTLIRAQPPNDFLLVLSNLRPHFPRSVTRGMSLPDLKVLTGGGRLEGERATLVVGAAGMEIGGGGGAPIVHALVIGCKCVRVCACRANAARPEGASLHAFKGGCR